MKGRTRVIEHKSARFGLNMMEAIIPRGWMQLMIFECPVQSNQICEVLKHLMHGHKTKVVVMWDGQPTHKSKKVKECIETFEGGLEVLLLQAYSPDLNPLEQVWNHAKVNGGGRKTLYDPDQLKTMIINKL